MQTSFWWHSLAEIGALLIERDAREWEIETIHFFALGTWR